MDERYLPQFNPRPAIQAVPIGPGKWAYVIDDVLLNPDALVELAVLSRGQFERPPTYAYPGLEWWLDGEFAARLDDFFRLHIRRHLGGRRTLRMGCRLSMVNFSPAELKPRQWQCHRDLDDVVPGELMAASVLYLFRNEQLGGTSFYRPRLPEDKTARLVRDGVAMSGPEFSRKYGVKPGYMNGSNEYFERTCMLPARWNRMVFYDGSVFHSGDIGAPEALGSDPTRARLTLNGFFVCRLAAGASTGD